MPPSRELVDLVHMLLRDFYMPVLKELAIKEVQEAVARAMVQARCEYCGTVRSRCAACGAPEGQR